MRNRCLTVCLGVATDGARHFIDLSVSNPLLISGVCGSGKTIFLRSILSELISINPVEKLQIVSVKANPHCTGFGDIISNHRDFFQEFSTEESGNELLQFLITEAHRRIHLFHGSGIHSLSLYNKQFKEPLPHLIVAIDNADRLFRVCEDALIDQFFEAVVRMWNHVGMTLIVSIQSLSLLAPWQYFVDAGFHIVFRTLDCHFLPFPNLKPNLLRCLDPGAHMFTSKNCETLFFQPTY